MVPSRSPFQIPKTEDTAVKKKLEELLVTARKLRS